MCTLVILRRPDHAWPVLLAANRDESADRPWRAPGRHWPDRENVVAGRDELAGGSWLGINDAGIAAGVLNRRDSLGPDPLLRSRGELVLEALDHADAADAAAALGDLDGHSYRSFNLVIADNRDAFWLHGHGPASDGRIGVAPLPPGLSMITAHDLNDDESPRIRHFHPLFEAASVPQPGEGAWGGWQEIMARRDFAPGAGPADAMTIVTGRGFGTLSSSLIGLAAPEVENPRIRWLFAPGRPDRTEYAAVEI